MGLLDDAIRDHLELKRRHGAGEDEVRRQEQEALGPPGRGQVPQPLSPPGEEPLDDPSDEAPARTVDEPPVAPPEDDPEAPPISADTATEEAWLDDPVEEPPPAAYAAPRTETSEPADESPEDVLEETPEFLQETPEHDRLWFEQKPPKDFDFDK
jgi:hypothetical protein